MKPPETFETTRLNLRRPIAADAIAIFEGYAQDPDVTRYLPWQPHKQIHQTYEFLERCASGWDDSSEFSWVLVRKTDYQLLGMVALRVGQYKADLGYVLARAYWGCGYMPEAVNAVVEWALQSAGVFRVWAVCDVDNTASARVLEKVGMEKEGTLRRWIIHPNISDEPRDSLCYSRTR